MHAAHEGLRLGIPKQITKDRHAQHAADLPRGIEHARGNARREASTDDSVALVMVGTIRAMPLAAISIGTTSSQ